MAEEERTTSPSLLASQTVTALQRDSASGERHDTLESHTHTAKDDRNEEPTQTYIFRGLVVDVS